MLRRVATLVCALGLGAAAVLGFASGELKHGIQNGRPGTYWVLGAGTIALVASVVLSWRAKRPRARWWVACIALPQIAALASWVWIAPRLDRAIAENVGEVVSRVVANGTAELTHAIVLADLFTVACTATLAIGFVQRGAIPKRALAVGALWFVASVVLCVLSLRGHEVALRPLVPVLVAMMVVVAVASPDDDLAPLVAFTGVLAVALLERAIAERARATAFGVIWYEDIPTRVQANALAEYLGVRSHARLAMGVHLVLGATTFGLARGLPRKPSVAGMVLVAIIAGKAFYEHRSFARRLDSTRNAFEVGVPLPTTSATSGWYVSGDRFVVTRDGALRELVFPTDEEEVIDPQEERMRPRPRSAKPVFADEEVTCGALAAALKPKMQSRQSFALATMLPAPNIERPFLGELEPLVRGRELVGLGFDLGHHYPIIDAVLSGDTFVLKLPGETLTYPLAVDPDEVARVVTARWHSPLPRNETVALTVHADDTVRRLAAALTILTVAFPMEGTWQHRYFTLHVE